MLVALTRGVSPAFDRCELTHVDRQTIDVGKARRQHRAYEECLREFGCRLESLPADPEYPDSVFVEDVAVVLDEVAVITRPGAPSRRGERTTVSRALEKHRDLVQIHSPGVLDGGDVLQVDRHLYVGLSSRSNSEGIDQLRRLVSSAGYSVTPVEFSGCLHLKSAVTRVGQDALLLNPRWVDARVFGNVKTVSVAPEEPSAGNALWCGGRALLPAQYPRTLATLEGEGLAPRTVDVSELVKAEAGVTCCSLIFESEGI